MAEEDTTKLNTSRLGTKEYWDQFYALERKNFKENPEDTGECWFDDSNAEERMVDFLAENVGEYLVSRTSSMIDLGTGNGHLLFELDEQGFSGSMLGVDYSSESVQFAKDVVKEKGIRDTIRFEQADIFDNAWNPGEFDVVLDKGTLDAIALSGITIDGRPITKNYSAAVEKLLKKKGVFLITSCNFTQEELIGIIETENLKVWRTVKYPVFEFGGKRGSTICTVAFVKS